MFGCEKGYLMVEPQCQAVWRWSRKDCLLVINGFAVLGWFFFFFFLVSLYWEEVVMNHGNEMISSMGCLSGWRCMFEVD